MPERPIRNPEPSRLAQRCDKHSPFPAASAAADLPSQASSPEPKSEGRKPKSEGAPPKSGGAPLLAAFARSGDFPDARRLPPDANSPGACSPWIPESKLPPVPEKGINSFVRKILLTNPLFPRFYADVVLTDAPNSHEAKILRPHYQKICEKVNLMSNQNSTCTHIKVTGVRCGSPLSKESHSATSTRTPSAAFAAPNNPASIPSH